MAVRMCTKRWSSLERSPCPDAIVAPAYTDGGLVREDRVAHSERNLQFAGEPPGIATGGKRARKILEPTADGFEERLEVDDGSGYVTYCVDTMQKVNAALPA